MSTTVKVVIGVVALGATLVFVAYVPIIEQEIIVVNDKGQVTSKQKANVPLLARMVDGKQRKITVLRPLTEIIKEHGITNKDIKL